MAVNIDSTDKRDIRATRAWAFYVKDMQLRGVRVEYGKALPPIVAWALEDDWCLENPDFAPERRGARRGKAA